jgi:putative ABC transport system permease protein
MRRAALGALLSHWRRHPLQLAMLLLGLSVATALWTGVQAINAEARASYGEAAQRTGGAEEIVGPEGKGVRLSDYVALRRAGWDVSPVVEGSLLLAGGNVRLIGIDPLTLPRENQPGEIDLGEQLGDFVGPAGVLIVAADVAARLREAEAPPFREDDSLPAGTVIADIARAQALLGTAPDELSRLTVGSNHAPDRPPLQQIAPQLAQRQPETTADLARLTDSFHLNLTAFGLLAFAVGLFIVYAAIGLAFEQRRGMFRTLCALGVSAGTLTSLLLAELVILALVAGAAGVGLGYLVAAALLPDVAATLRGLYGADVPGALALRPAWVAAGLAIAAAGALAAGAQGLWRISRLPVIESAKPRALGRLSERGLVLQAAAAVAILAGGWLALQLANGLIAGFAVLGALLLGAALLLPAALYLLLRAAQRLARGALAQWFWADARQQLSGLSLALMALLLALAANIGVGTMVGSFRETFVGYLDQRLAAELYVQARTDEEARTLSERIDPEVDAVLPMWSVEAELLGGPAEIFGMIDHATYRRSWPLLAAAPDPWGSLAAGRGVLVNEQLARRNKLKPGDPLELPGGALPIVGVYSDYGNPAGQAVLGLATFATRFPDADRRRFGLRVSPDRIEAVRARLTGELGLPASNVIDQAGLKRFSLNIFERTFTVTGALNVLTLAVAGLALFASLATLSGVRVAQLAPVWALGLTRVQLAGLELARLLALAALTMLAAIPTGLALAWVLLSVVNVEAFGWLLPMHIYPAEWLELAALALGAAVLAAAAPLHRLARLQPAELLKVFAHER